MPDASQFPPMPVFPRSSTTTSGLDLLASAAGVSGEGAGKTTPSGAESSLGKAGPYNPAAALPPRVVKKILDLEFVEMAELSADIWVEELPPSDTGLTPRRTTAKPPVTDIKVWLECFARMAALLVTRFPDKGPELWAYQTTILRAAHNYEGSNWVAYDRQFRRDMLARKDLNWSSPNTRLYNEAFTGRAKAIPRCSHCLGEDHTAPICPHNPHPPVIGWIPDPRQYTPTVSSLQPPQPGLAGFQGGGARAEICRSFNENRCKYTRCRFQHICLACAGPHPATTCPRGAMSGGLVARNRAAARGRQSLAHPYLPGRR